MDSVAKQKCSGSELVDALHLQLSCITDLTCSIIWHDIFSGAELGQAISEAESIVAEMELRNFEGQNDKVEVELELAKELLESMQNFFTPVKVCSFHCVVFDIHHLFGM